MHAESSVGMHLSEGGSCCDWDSLVCVACNCNRVFIGSVWQDIVNLTPVDMLGDSVSVTIQAALDAVNLVTQGKGRRLYFGHKFVPHPDNQAGPKLSAKPQPDSPACE